MSNFQTTNFFAIAKAHTSPQDDPFLGIHTFRYAQHVSSKEEYCFETDEIEKDIL